jgi:YHS domain-containing protein
MITTFLRTVLAAFALAFVAVAGVVTPAQAAEPATFTVRGNLAVGGYDPVAYFTVGAPVQGKAEFALTYQDAVYHFSSAANRDAFRASPARYAPQYGGYCAYAVSQNKLAPGRPQHWAVVDGKLFLNFSAGVQKTWNKDRVGYIAKANSFWPAVLDKQSGLFSF